MLIKALYESNMTIGTPQPILVYIVGLLLNQERVTYILRLDSRKLA